MMYRLYTILEEPKDAEYSRLLRTLSCFCKYALLVVRPTIPLSPYGREVLQALEQDIVIQEERQEWPGTRLVGGSAIVYLIRLTHSALETLCGKANRLYAWEQPHLPEDLCLMRNEAEPMLVSISHERDAYLFLSEGEWLALSSALPNLRLRAEESRQQGR